MYLARRISGIECLFSLAFKMSSVAVELASSICIIHPKCSMYGIFTNIYPKNHPNVGKSTIHGAYGHLRTSRSCEERSFCSSCCSSVAPFPQKRRKAVSQKTTYSPGILTKAISTTGEMHPLQIMGTPTKVT